MKASKNNPHSLTRRLSVATLALAALTPLAAAIAQAPKGATPGVDSIAPEPAKDAAATPDPKAVGSTVPTAVPTEAEAAQAAAKAKAADEAARKKCEEDKPKNPCAPKKKKKCE